MIDISHDELRDYLYHQVVDIPASNRVHAYWELNADWLNRIAVFMRAIPGNGWDGNNIMGYSSYVTESAGKPVLICGINPDFA